MYKGFLVLLLPFFLSSCAWHVIDDPGRKNNGENETIISEGPTDEEKAVSIYDEAVKALDEGDAYFAKQKLHLYRIEIQPLNANMSLSHS